MRYDVVIIGAGIVGLATGYRLLEKRPDLKIALLDKEDAIASHQTGHNSGVIHSGIYYKPGSLKATNCVRGYRQLLAFCRENEIPHDVCGKVIVATEKEQLPILDRIFERGNKNGLTGLKKISEEEIKAIEPHVSGIQGIRVPQAGIIGFKRVAEKLAEKIQAKDGEVILNSKVKEIELKNNMVRLETEGGEYETALAVNCAGLYSDKVAQLTHPGLDVRIIPFRGEYYKLKKESAHLVQNLIYPVPDPNFPFLGVHFTRMINGDIEAGPNAVLAFSREGYKKSDIDIAELFATLTWPGFQKVSRKYWRTGLDELYRSFSKSAFTKALQKLIPEIISDDLEAGGSGVRAQACSRDGNLIDDFMILEEERVINVCNAPSPAATSCLSIGETIAGKAMEHLG